MYKKSKKKIEKVFRELFESVRRHSKNRLFNFVLLNAGIIAFQVVYILLRKSYLMTVVPLWYTKYWGDYQLAPKNLIFLIPLISAVLVLGGFILMALLNKYYVRFVSEIIFFFITFSNFVLAFQVVRIILVSSAPFVPLLNPLYMELLPYLGIAFLSAYLTTPLYINFAKNHDIITNPHLHAHPGMILKIPSARGSGVLYSVLFLALSLIFFGLNPGFLGMYLSLFLLMVLSFVDDYQNTHPASSFKVLENPLLRLILLCSAVSVAVMSGIKIESVSNPLTIFTENPLINLRTILPDVTVLYPFGGVLIFFATVVWIVWFMNVLSWSNGIDGQFSGIVGIASLVVALLSLRFPELTPFHKQVAAMAAISAGISFGFVPYTWYPSKIMWSFGAVSAGLVISVLSLFSQSKILTSILIILIPFLDALVILFRRLFQGKNPLKGDRGHLHHLLLARGWSVPKIATFYWITTAVFGLIGVLLSEKYTLQATLILGGIVAFFIILLNIRSAQTKSFFDENSVHSK